MKLMMIISLLFFSSCTSADMVNRSSNGGSIVCFGDSFVRLDEYVLVHYPKMVIVTLGVNDALQEMSKAETLKNIRIIIDRIQAGGAMVVWTDVRTGEREDVYLKEFRSMASQKGVLLIEDVLRDIATHQEYMPDIWHPNAKGYALMAERIYQEIKVSFSDCCLK